MSFADWKKRSKLYQTVKSRAERFGIRYDEVAQAAYKAGERDGRKQAEMQPTTEEAKKMKKTISISVNGAEPFVLVLPDTYTETDYRPLVVAGRIYKYKSTPDSIKMDGFLRNLLEGKL